MSVQLLILLFCLFCPSFIALSAGLLLFFAKRKVSGYLELTYPLFAYFISIFIIWTQVVFFFFRPDLNSRLLPFAYLSVIYVPLFLYHYIYNMTKTGESNRFPWQHYLVPLSIYVMVLVRGDIAGSGPMFRFVLTVIYGVLSILRVRNYRQTLNAELYNDPTYSFAWLNSLIYLTFLSIFVTFCSTLFDFNQTTDTLLLFMGITALMITFQIYLVLIYSFRLNVAFLKELRLLNMEDEDEVEISEYEPETENVITIQVEDFEELVIHQKMYLNPYLKMSDLLIPLKTNRDYLSKFVNQTYRMNFKTYINSLRLEEYRRLRNNPEMKMYDVQELIFRSGFTNYKQYLRAKNIEK